MASNLRFVFDIDVLISALLMPRSVPRQALDLAFTRGEVLASSATLDEFDDVVRRPKFNRYILEAERLEFLAQFIHDIQLIEIREAIAACRDPKDDKFLELAISGQAGAIISGDEDLLILHSFRGISILTPRDFVGSF